MEDLWKQIDKWLETNAPKVLSDLQQGAKISEIGKVEKSLGITFPEDVRKSYTIHDGQSGAVPLFRTEWTFLSLKNVLKRWQMLKKLLDEGKFVGNSSEPEGSVKSDWWNPGWIPLLDNESGDYYCLDMSPDKKGHTGQIITFRHDNPKRIVAAKSFRAWLEIFVDDLKKKRYRFEDNELVYGDD